MSGFQNSRDESKRVLSVLLSDGT